MHIQEQDGTLSYDILSELKDKLAHKIRKNPDLVAPVFLYLYLHESVEETQKFFLRNRLYLNEAWLCHKHTPHLRNGLQIRDDYDTKDSAILLDANQKSVEELEPYFKKDFEVRPRELTNWINSRNLDTLLAEMEPYLRGEIRHKNGYSR